MTWLYGLTPSDAVKNQYGEFWLWRLSCCKAQSSSLLAAQCWHWITASAALAKVCRTRLNKFTHQYAALAAKYGNQWASMRHFIQVAEAVDEKLTKGEMLSHLVRTYLLQRHDREPSTSLEQAGQLFDILVHASLVEGQHLRSKAEEGLIHRRALTLRHEADQLKLEVGKLLLQRSLCVPVRSLESEAQLLSILASQGLEESGRLRRQIQGQLR